MQFLQSQRYYDSRVQGKMTITILAGNLSNQDLDGGRYREEAKFWAHTVLDTVLNILHVFSFNPHNNSIRFMLCVWRQYFIYTLVNTASGYILLDHLSTCDIAYDENAGVQREV